MSFLSEFNSKYAEIFGRSHFNQKIPIFRPTKFEEELIEKFTQGVLELSAPMFYFENRWNLNYWFLGELCSEMQLAGQVSVLCLKFHRPTWDLEVNPEFLFTLMMILRSRLLFRMGSLKKTGFPDWFKNEDFDKFYKNLMYLQNTRKTVRGILRGRRVEVEYVRDQDAAINLVKGKISDEKIDKVLKIVHNRAPGVRKVKDQSVKGIRRQASQLFLTVKEIFIEEWIAEKTIIDDRHLAADWEKFRMTHDRATKAILYWGLMGTISYRKNRVISASAETEKEFFGKSYRIIRKAMERLGMIKCSDATYCPGVRCRDFEVWVMMPKSFSVNADDIRLNDIEKEFMAEKDEHERRAIASECSKFAYAFLIAKEKMLFSCREIDILNKKIKSKAFVIRNFGDENGEEFKSRHRNDLYLAQRRRRKLAMVYDDFMKRFSDASAYVWDVSPLGTERDYKLAI